MNVASLDPVVSEFATQQDAEAYDTWFRAKVAASLDDPRPSIPNDEAMSRIHASLAPPGPPTAP